jgi:presenilin-like A22 family membrane protease
MEENDQIKGEGVKTFSFEKPWRLFLIEAFLFSLTLILGIATAFKINKISEIQKIEIPQISPWKFLIEFFLATLFFILLIRFLKFKKGRGVIFKIIFILAIFLGGASSINAWLSGLTSLTLMVILILWWLKKPSVLNQDILMVFGMAGVGSVLGLSLKPEIVVILLVIFSIYDFIAVYKTKHMVKMAKEMMESKAILAIVIPQNIFGFRESLTRAQPGGQFLILGGGDIVFPLILCVSLIPFGILKSSIVALFSLIGLFASFWFFISQKTRQPIPALPPIALFSIIGFFITLII